MMGVPGIKPLLDEPKPGSLAAAGGFEKGDLVIAIDGKPTPTLSAVMLELVDRAMAGEIIQSMCRTLKIGRGFALWMGATSRTWLKMAWCLIAPA